MGTVETNLESLLVEKLALSRYGNKNLLEAQLVLEISFQVKKLTRPLPSSLFLNYITIYSANSETSESFISLFRRF